MTTVIINDSSREGKNFLRYVKTLPFAEVVEKKKMTFEEAAAECNAISVDQFFDKLDARIAKWPDHA